MWGFFQRKMNLCLTKPCPRGYAFHDVFEFQLDYFGGFRFEFFCQHVLKLL